MSKKSRYGIKISHKNFDVKNLNRARSQKPVKKLALLNLLSSIALPYLLGAKKQVKRYKETACYLDSQPAIASMSCLHEASNLFEDLNTVSIYMKKCNKDHRLRSLWNDIRNYIRHAVREEFNKEKKTIKNARSQRLGLDPRLQIDIEFDTSFIKIGKRKILITEINSYLTWAEETIANFLSAGEKEGYFRQE